MDIFAPLRISLALLPPCVATRLKNGSKRFRINPYTVCIRMLMKGWGGQRDSNPRGVEWKDYSGTGLPKGFVLYWLTGLDRLEPSQLAGLPGLEGGAPQQHRVLWLTAGTLVKGSASRRVYAEYAPPFVNLHANAGLELKADGAKLNLLSEGHPVRGRPGDVVRTYSLDVLPGSSIVILSAIRNGNTAAPRPTLQAARKSGITSEAEQGKFSSHPKSQVGIWHATANNGVTVATPVATSGKSPAPKTASP